METLSANLIEIQKLTCGDFRDLIIAADLLWAVLKERPFYEQASDLREQLDRALNECKETSRQWMMKNNLEWMRYNRAGYEAMLAFVMELSVKRIGEERSKENRDDTLGLFLELAPLVQKPGTFQDLVPFLPKAVSKMPSQSQPKLGKKE